jgi:hypothetical protein
VNYALDQKTAAHEILSTATERTDDVLWAIGVAFAQHPWDLVAAWDGGPLIGGEMHGKSLEHRRWIVARGGRITIEQEYGGAAIVTVDQGVVRRIVAAHLIPAGLVAEVRALHAERSAEALVDMDLFGREQRGEVKPTQDERLARSVHRADIERRCDAAGARVWAAVDPRARPEQLDLFDLAGGAP